jgi:demethylmacrocin O-methyltransferase
MNLCELAEKYNVDKCPKVYHYYTPEYHKILKDFSPKQMLEIGIGTHQIMKSICGKDYVVGASLRMWKEYFTNCKIVGIDINEQSVKDAVEDRIDTYLSDQSCPVSLENLVQKTGNFDFIIDDGSHLVKHQLISIKSLWKNLNSGGIYIIEDIPSSGPFEDLHYTLDSVESYRFYKHPKDRQGFVVFKKKS